jgi:membrane protease YdiL (CAAX protease family)
VAVLGVQGVIVYRARLGALQSSGVAPDRILIYQRTILFAWLMLGFVLAGVWRHGSPMATVLGERWRSAGRFLQDARIGLLFLMVSIAMGSAGESWFGQGNNAATLRILPRGGIETWYWVALSISAGICEEGIYRGYLQRQFTAVLRNVPAGIVLSGMVFGGAHLYQGFGRAVSIALLGVLGGVLAHWRKSVRPGMIAHILQDLMGGLVRQ